MSITVYSRQGCSKCQDLKSFLNMLDIDFYEIDLDSNIDMTEVLREKGFRQLPIINFNDTWLSDSEEFKSDVRYKINFINKLKNLVLEFYNSFNQKTFIKYHIKKELIYSTIQKESQGRNIRSRKKGSNGYYDWGLGQVNGVHAKDKKALLELNYNIKFCVDYLASCIKKTRGNIPFAISLYNRGINSNPLTNKNYKYVADIHTLYILTSN